MQTLGIWLQLAGSVITLGGLLWAWHVASGRISLWRDTMRDRLVRLGESVVARLAPPPPPPTGGFIATTLPKMTTQAFGTVDNGTDEQRLARLETENARRADEVRELRAEIDKARAAALEEFKTSSNAIRVRDIYPAALGILVSIAGTACQLIG
ncbi:hypothetical protein A5739_11375 [Mycobacterium colombiense]|uniref:hypothetical protein n=1 Tax=Mycobacterium colombiense TaxID=339268 RepID=UPI00096FD417|nr:hypothetical protein [Mycobacterium colombiense]OMC32013.1 hypothetical protein A5739_11375 [Mycobacterium colombiense]